MTTAQINPTDTAADIKMKIEQAQAEEDAKGSLPKPAPQKIEPPKKSAGKKAEPPQAIKPPEPKAEDKAGEPPPKEEGTPLDWAKKKGLNTPEDIARSLRAMEEEFHRRNQTKWKQPEPAQQVPPMNNVPPNTPVQPTYSPVSDGYPTYIPPPSPPIPPRNVLEQISRQYNIPPVDAERLIAFNNDFMEVKLRQRDQVWEERFRSFQKENARNSEFVDLMRDPVFKDPQVVKEVHRVFEENPEVFSKESAPYKWAYKEALANIARRYLQGSEDGNSIPISPPNNPPTPLGSGSGGGEGETTMFSEKEWAALPLEEKARILNQMGVRRTTY